MDQFIGKPFWITLGALAATFGLSMLVFQTPLALVALVAAVAGSFALTVKRTELGLAAAFAELFANSHGHLISADIGGFPFSLRQAVFLGVMAGWMVNVLRRQAVVPIRDGRLAPFIALAAAAAVGFLIGFLQNDPMKAFRDGNAYLYLAYVLPVLSVPWDGARKRLLLHVLAASAVWVSIVSLGLLYIFTHFPEWVLGPVYEFIRDTRTGELTKMCDVVDSPAGGALCGIFRIFLQAQFSVIVAVFFASPFLWVSSLPKRDLRILVIGLSVATSAILISLSRSFWVGIIAGVLVYLPLCWHAFRPTVKRAARAVAFQALTFPLAALVLVLIMLFPFPYRVGTIGDLSSLFKERATDTGDVAISSRWNLLDPLLDEVKAHPFIGSGFGEEVTFLTDDPRARAINPDGTWTTYALEWGWLEIWLKTGLLGLLAFAWVFISMVRGFWPMLRSEQGWIAIAGITSLVMLYATHSFSPYLNHPLGLGLLLFLLPFLNANAPTVVVEASKVVSAKPVAQVSVSPLISE